MRRLVSLLAATILLGGCARFSEREATDLVRTYNTKVIEAFRSGDPRIVDPVTSVHEGQKLLGLIGVKLDMGLTLDAQLLEIQFLGVERDGSRVSVRTEERWHYRERRIGSGEPVGQESTDHYFMLYHLAREGGRWVVDRIEFARPPEVGRTEVPNAAAPQSLHGFARPGQARATPPAGGGGKGTR